jgi:hypothetical protein
VARAGTCAAAAERYVRAHELAPESVELEFWAGLALAGGGGDPDRGLRHVRNAIAARRVARAARAAGRAGRAGRTGGGARLGVNHR